MPALRDLRRNPAAAPELLEHLLKQLLGLRRSRYLMDKLF
jgi:hypothetical protein